MSLAIIAITEGGKKLGRRLAGLLNADLLAPEPNIAECLAAAWPRYRGFIMIMATGIVVRSIAPLLKDKRLDPAVVVLDEEGNFAISLLSGHLGGANDLAIKIANSIGAQAVITTASDTLGLTAIDLWAKKNSLRLESGSFSTISARLVNNGRITVFQDEPYQPLPREFEPVSNYQQAELIISNRLNSWPQNVTVLRPANLVVGIGCNRNTPINEIRHAVNKTCQINGLSLLSIFKLTSIDLKADEPGLLAYAKEVDREIVFFKSSQLNQVQGISHSQAVYKATGAYGVCEPAAILGANLGKLIVKKVKWKNVTIAIAQTNKISKADYR